MPASIRGHVVYPKVEKPRPVSREYKRGRPWSISELEYLDKWFGKEAPENIARKLSRTKGAVNHMASCRGLTDSTKPAPRRRAA